MKISIGEYEHYLPIKRYILKFKFYPLRVVGRDSKSNLNTENLVIFVRFNFREFREEDNIAKAKQILRK